LAILFKFEGNRPSKDTTVSIRTFTGTMKTYRWSLLQWSDTCICRSDLFHL